MGGCDPAECGNWAWQMWQLAWATPRPVGNTYGVDVSSPHGKIQASPPARITARVSLGVTSGYAKLPK